MASFTKLFAGMVALLLTHLYPASQPFYENADVIYAPGLIGEYVPLRLPQARPSSHGLVFIRDGAQAYRLIVRDGQRTVEFKAVLFRIEAGTFLDLVPVRGAAAAYGFDAGKSHLAARVDWDRFGVRFRLVERGLRWNEAPSASSTHDLREQLRRGTGAASFSTLAEFYRI